MFCKNFSAQNLANRTVDVNQKKMVTCCVKGCLNQSKLNKNVSYHKVLGEERKD